MDKVFEAKVLPNNGVPSGINNTLSSYKINERRRSAIERLEGRNSLLDQRDVSAAAKTSFILARDLIVPRSSSYSGASLVKNKPQRKNFAKSLALPAKPKRKMKRSEDRLKVAVRVRPFNDREKARKAKLIIEMAENTTIITDPEQKFPERKFTFDYSYWSHDGFTEREDGYLLSDGSRYADQSRVFDDLGKGVLENAWKGFNCSLFAYGQTGSGKSYSMVGYNPNKGIIPITCEQLFKGIEEKKSTDDSEREAEYQVSVSMLEIYNETVKDLLNIKSFKKGGLRIREHPQKGFYVEQLQISPVSDYAAIEARIAEGTRNRTLAATNMNATSSRAHTIVAINFAQKAKNDAGKSMTKTSIINLVDLAGSERADSTGATGDRLKEGSMINKSLLCLGNCIKALADVQEGKHVSVPFRDSMLTRLLKNALGGNSKTIMIAALSPADINYEETLSTLRFADRAKAIKTKAVVNESPTDKLIREMKEEITRLQGLLKNQEPGGAVVVQGISPEEVEEMRRAQEEELKRNQEEIDKMKQTWEQRLEEQSKLSQQQLDDEKSKQLARKTTPNLWNLNEDPMLTGMIVHLTPPGVMVMGSADPASIILKGLSINKEHAVIENDSNSVVHLTPSGDSKLLINGKVISQKTELRHNDRVMLGSNHLYVFHHPQDAARQEKEGKFVEKVSFDSAQEEIAQNKGFDMGKTGKSKEDILLQEDLIRVMPMVNEANAMSEVLDKKMLYEIALISPQAQGLKEGRTKVSIKAKKLVNGNEFLWNRNDFLNRKYSMQEMYQAYMEEDEDWDKTQEDGYPFSAPDDDSVIIGTAYLYIQSLAYLMDMEDNLAVRSYNAKETGVLSIEAFPCSDRGELLLDECVEDPDELVGKSYQFKIKIRKVLALPKRIIKVWCRYKFLMSDDWNESPSVDASLNTDLNFDKMFKAFPVTKELIEEMDNNPIIIQVWGNQKSEPEDPSRVNMTTKELIGLEDAITLYKPDKKAAPNKAGHESKELRKKESEIFHLQSTMNNYKSAQQATEQQNLQLKQENDENKRRMLSMQAKLDLLANMVKEAQSKGDQIMLVARMDHILQTAKDLSKKDIKKLLKQVEKSTKSHDPPPQPALTNLTTPPSAQPPHNLISSSHTPPAHHPTEKVAPSPVPQNNGRTASENPPSVSSLKPPSRQSGKSAKSGVCNLL